MDEIVLGDSRPFSVQLQIDGETFIINPDTDTVKVAIVTTDNKAAIVPAMDIASTLPGSDWAISKIIVKFPRSSTDSLNFQGNALLEIQVTFASTDDDWTWFIPVSLRKGNV